MSKQFAKHPSLYDQLVGLPEGLTGEIINGQLRTHPRPAWPHLRVESILNRRLGRAYDDGDDGPGGWWILDVPEVHFVLDTEVTVPDLAGWRRERLPIPPEGHKITTVPDWICEVFSPSTKSTDREEKMPLYARHGVRHAWLVDPNARTLEAYRLDAGSWAPLGMFRDDDRVCVAPFDAVSIHLAELWT